MDDMEEKLSAILGNPQMMSQIMSMAQSLGGAQTKAPQNGQQSASDPQPSPAPPSFAGGMDPGMIQKLAGLAGQTGVDRNQRALLTALHPYLSTERIRKLENAMRAAKLAGVASAFLSKNGILSPQGR